MALAPGLSRDGGVIPVRVGDRTINIEVTPHGTRLYLKFAYHEGLKNEVKDCLEGAKWEKDMKVWSCRNSPRNWYILQHVWQDSPEFNRYYDEQIKLLNFRYPKMWETQKYGASAWIHRKRMYYAGKQGTGKMLLAYAGIDYILTHNLVKDPIVWWVGSTAALKAFEDEYALWKPLFTPRVLTTYSSLPNVIEAQSRPPRIVIFDEITALKTPSTIQTQAALGLTELMEREYGDECYVLGLSGTPDPKDKADWWSQCEVIRPGFIRERDIHKFRDRYAYQEEFELPTKEAAGEAESGGKKRSYKKVIAWKMGQTIIGKKEDPETGMMVDTPIELPDEVGKLPKRLAGLVIRHDERDLPIKVEAPVYIEIEIPPSKKDLMVAESIANTSLNALTALGRLRQYADGFQYSKGEPTAFSKDSPKLKKLREQLALRKAHGRLVIYSAYTASVDKIVETCLEDGWSVIRVDGRGWHGFGCEPELKVFRNKHDYNFPLAFVAHPRSGGEAVTLKGMDSMHFFSNTYQAKDRWQAEERRRYTKIDIVDYLFLPSDYKVVANLKGKKNASELTLEELRRLFWTANGKDPDAEAKKLEANPLPLVEESFDEEGLEA